MPYKSYQNILIIKPSSLGDIVHALPAVLQLRNAMPDARLTWMVRNQFAAFLKEIKEVDRRLLFDRKAMAAWFYKPRSFKALCDFRRDLKASNFDLVLDLQGLLRSALFAWMTGCTERIGLAEAREGARFFYTRSVPQPAGSAHIIDYYYALLRQLDIAPQPHSFKLTASMPARQSISNKIASTGLQSRQFLVLVPGSAHADKCWPAERFAKVAEEIHDHFGFEIAAVGTSHDKEIIRLIQTCCRCRIADFSGKTTLPELVALFEQSAAVLANDTGPGHIAAAVGIPLVMVFGRTNPLRLEPYGRPECVAAIDREKRGIAIDSKNPAWSIEHVSVERVLDKMTRQLQELRPA